MIVARNVAAGPATDRACGRQYSETGRFVAFDSAASDLLCGRTCGPHERNQNLVADVFVFDGENRSMRRLSQGPASGPWCEPSLGPAMDAGWDVVAFS